jgi:hypothetical protein
MDTHLASFLRGLVGFLAGGAGAAASAAVTLATICPIPPDVPGQPNYGPMALSLVVIVTFLCGGAIGAFGFTTRRVSSLLWPVAGAYGFMLALWLLSDASWYEAGALIAFASVGLVISVTLSLVVMRWFPQRVLHDTV